MLPEPDVAPLTPFCVTVHEYVAPLTSDVKVIVGAVLLHIVCDVGVAVTFGIGFTVMVIIFDVAGEPVAHVAVEVISHVTKSLFVSVEVIYAVPPVPTLLLFSFH